MKDYTGRDPDHINPVLVELLRNLAPGGQPVLRIGGNSTDQTWWPIRGLIPGGGVKYGLTNGWLRTTKALAQALNAKLILGVNLADGQPALAAAEARAFIQGIGRQYIDAIEIGNEPDVYGQFAWYRAPDGRVFFARRSTYSLSRLRGGVRPLARGAPGRPARRAGDRRARLAERARATSSRRVETCGRHLHRYPLRGCNHRPHVAALPLDPEPAQRQPPRRRARAERSRRTSPSPTIARSRVPARRDELGLVSAASRA